MGRAVEGADRVQASSERAAVGGERARWGSPSTSRASGDEESSSQGTSGAARAGLRVPFTAASPSVLAFGDKLQPPCGTALSETRKAKERLDCTATDEYDNREGDKSGGTMLRCGKGRDDKVARETKRSRRRGGGGKARTRAASLRQPARL